MEKKSVEGITVMAWNCNRGHEEVRWQGKKGTCWFCKQRGDGTLVTIYPANTTLYPANTRNVTIIS